MWLMATGDCRVMEKACGRGRDKAIEEGILLREKDDWRKQKLMMRKGENE